MQYQLTTVTESGWHTSPLILTGASRRKEIPQHPFYPLDPFGVEAISRQCIFPQELAERHSLEEDFRDPHDELHDLPDRTPGEIQYLQWFDWMPQQLFRWFLHGWICDQPLVTTFLLRCLDDLFSLGLITNRRSAIARLSASTMSASSKPAQTMLLYQREPSWPRAYTRPQNHEIGLSPITISQILVGDHTNYNTAGACNRVLHCTACRCDSWHKRGARFPVSQLCCDILPTLSDNKQVTQATRHR